MGLGGYGGFGSGSTKGDWDAATWHGGQQAGLMGKGGIDRVLDYIAIDGTAQIRVKPQEIRVVMAVMTEGETAAACQEANDRQVEAVRKAWLAMKIPKEKIVEDFIAVLPRYEWKYEVNDDNPDFLVQKVAGHRMQSNLHVIVGSEAEAMKAVYLAFQQGVSDIITFQYWSPELDAKKIEARKMALAAAKKKADLLLSVFAKRPPVINIQERTKAYFPHSLYQTFENVLEETIEYNNSRRMTRVKAYRPKMTFFHGLNSTTDVRPDDVPMRPEIAVISTVTIYYQSPATKSSESK